MKTIELRQLDAEGLLAIDSDYVLDLSLMELQTIQAFFEQEDRVATMVELKVFSHFWSDRCAQKVFQGKIDYVDAAGASAQIDSLLQEYVLAVNEKINKPDLVAGLTEALPTAFYDVTLEMLVADLGLKGGVENGRLHLYYDGKLATDIDATLMRTGYQLPHMQAHWQPQAKPQKRTDYNQQLKETLLKILAEPRPKNKIRLISDNNPDEEQIAAHESIRVHNDAFDPYKLAWAMVDEAMCNLVVAGADPEQVVIAEGYGWRNVDVPAALGALIRCVQGCAEAATAYDIPFVGSKGLMDGREENGRSRNTLHLTTTVIQSQNSPTITPALKNAGDFLFVVGDTRAELGDSHFSKIGAIAREGNHNYPEPAHDPFARILALYQAIQAGLVQACLPCGAGGVATAMAEMCLAGDIGLEVQLMRIPRDWHANYSADEVILFSESLTRFLVEIHPDNEAAFRALFKDVPHECVGIVGGDGLRINGRIGQPLLSASLEELRNENLITRPFVVTASAVF